MFNPEEDKPKEQAIDGLTQFFSAKLGLHCLEQQSLYSPITDQFNWLDRNNGMNFPDSSINNPNFWEITDKNLNLIYPDMLNTEKQESQPEQLDPFEMQDTVAKDTFNFKPGPSGEY